MDKESTDKKQQKTQQEEVLHDGRTWEEVCMSLYYHKPKHEEKSTEVRDKLYNYFYEQDSPYHSWFLPDDFFDKK